MNQIDKDYEQVQGELAKIKQEDLDELRQIWEWQKPLGQWIVVQVSSPDSVEFIPTPSLKRLLKAGLLQVRTARYLYWGKGHAAHHEVQALVTKKGERLLMGT